ncbi:MAG TPA: PIG-L family deacetylase [Pyrinomonadaceae bacterium]|nr:PIG-L family deacetylase [Pyrinomonadaceae bacterium]
MNKDKHRFFSITNYKLQITNFSSLSVSICVYLWLITLCLLAFPYKTNAQVRPVYDYGAIGLGQLLKRLNTTASVMMIGAHPDDEDSALLAYLARGENARTAYLSLTRGDGGQNIIGSELFESLGVIRTEELLQARRLDGAQQFFTRAFDYGFSKTLTEAKQKWDENIILCDTVRAIRTFRPLVVISRFSGTPADGHGQHQYSGYISPLAVKAASDANQCKESGAAWQVLKFYVEQGFRSTAEPSLKINTGAYDYLLGRSYFEIAIEGRSQHQTQEQGGLELKGEQFSGLNLSESKVPKVENEKSVFDGINTSLTAILKLEKLPENSKKSEIIEIQTLAEQALKEYELSNPQKVVPILIKGLNLIQTIAPGRLPAKFSPDFNKILSQKNAEFSEAVKLASGIQIDALSNKETIAPDESFQTSVKVFFPKTTNAKVKEITWNLPSRWQVSKIEKPQETTQSFRRETANETAYFNVKVPPDAQPTQPFWLRNKRKGDLFDLQPDENLNQPFEPPLINCLVTIELNGTKININQPVEYRFADDIRGEIRRDLNVVPKISLSFDQNLLVVPQNDKQQTRKLILSVKNNSLTMMSGSTDLELPNGWRIKQDFGIFQMSKKGESKSFEFDIIIPANTKAGEYNIQANAGRGEEMFNQTMNEIAYPHIQTHRFYTSAKTKVVVLDLKVAPVTVGYIMGSGDAVPEAIRQMGLTVDLLNENDLTGGDLSRFDTIVVGIRAFQVRQDLISNNQKILDYVKNGGNLIVQYQRPDYVQQKLNPFPASMTDTRGTTAGTTARVADENAKVTILEPDNTVFNFPNKITGADFSGWVQERNLYNFTTFDPKYTPLLESHDANEAENKGGLVVAEFGKGKYVYCSYAFFRQLPTGVSGAYRLFANLLSLTKSKKLKTKN